MKLLIITDAWFPQVNGVVRTYEHLIEELTKKGYDIKVVSPADFSFFLPMPGYNEIPVTLFPAVKLKRIIEDFGPDNIHISTEGSLGWAGRKYCLKTARSFTSAYHTHFPDYIAKRVAKFCPFLYGAAYRISKKFIKTFHAPASLIMVATPSLEDTLRRWGFTAPLHRLTRGARLDRFYPGEKKLFQDLPKPIALYVGRVAIEKNLEEFLKMEWEGSKVIVGDGPSLKQLTTRYPKAHFLGAKKNEELADHYRSADLFAFPSRTDTFGMVLVEALASGLPVAAFNVMGPKDIITDDSLGALHEHDLATAARLALKSGNAEARTAHVKQYYTWENAAKQFEEALLAERKMTKPSHKSM